MKISSRVDYALSCVLRIADKRNLRRPVTIGEVARKEKLALDYVEQFFIAMKKSGILKSVRGKAGGYILAKSPNKITVKDVVMAMDKVILQPICYRKKSRRCIHLADCKIRFLWEGLKENTESYLQKYTLDGLVGLRRKEKSW